MSCKTRVGTCLVRFGWEELGGNVSCKTWVGTCLVRLGWEELGGNVSCKTWVGTCLVRLGWEHLPEHLPSQLLRDGETEQGEIRTRSSEGEYERPNPSTVAGFAVRHLYNL